MNLILHEHGNLDAYFIVGVVSENRIDPLTSQSVKQL